MFKIDKGGAIEDPDLLNFAGQMKKGRGLAMFIGCIEGNPITDFPAVVTAEAMLTEHLHKNNITGFGRAIVSNNLYESFVTAYQTVGIAALKPNTIITSWNYGWREDPKGSTDFVNQLKAAVAAKLAIIIFKQSQEDQAVAVISNDRRLTGNIDIWWVVHDGGLLLLIPYLLTLHKVYGGCKLCVFAVSIDDDSSLKETEELTAQFLEKIRIHAQIIAVNIKMEGANTASENGHLSSGASQEIVRATSSGDVLDDVEKRVKDRSDQTRDLVSGSTSDLQFAASLNAEIKKFSDDAVLVVTNLPVSLTCTPEDFMAFTSTITQDIKSCALVRGCGDEVVTKYG